VVAPDKGGQAAGARAVEAGAERAGPFEIEHADRLDDALDRDAAPVAELKVALHQPRGLFGEAGFGKGFHALRDADIVAERGIVHAQIVADPPDHHLARVEADADVELDAVLDINLLRESAYRIADVQGGEAGSLSVVLVRNRSPKQRHDAVAGERVHRALEPIHAVGGNLEEILDDTKPLFGIEAFGEVHRAFDIGEQDGDVLALAFQRGFRLADLVGEMLGWERRVRGGRFGRRRGGRQRRAAVAAELLVGLVRCAAYRAGKDQPRPARGAEFPSFTIIMSAGGSTHAVSFQLPRVSSRSTARDSGPIGRSPS